MTIFFSMNYWNIFFQLRNPLFESGSASWTPKKAKNGLPGVQKATLLILLHVIKATECDKKGGMSDIERQNKCIKKAFNIFYKFGVKSKGLIKSYSTWNKRNKLLVQFATAPPPPKK